MRVGDLGRGLSRLHDPARERVNLHPVRARRAAQELERLFDVEREPFGEHAFRLLDHDPCPQRVLELRASLVRRFGDAEQTPHEDLQLFGRVRFREQIVLGVHVRDFMPRRLTSA